MSYKVRKLQDAVTTNPPLGALIGGAVAKKDRVLASHAQADSLLGNGRRVLARVGLHGSAALQVGNVDPDTVGQVYPALLLARRTARLPPVALTPGHWLKLSALVLPSGMTQKYVSEPGSWIGDTPYGRIEVVVTWTGPVVQVTTHKIEIQPSKLKWAAENTVNDGASWHALRRVEIPLMRPKFLANDGAAMRSWSDAVTASIEIRYIGGVRAIDVVVQETPWFYVRDVDSDTQFATTLATNGEGETVGSYPLEYPVEARTATDPTFGSELLANVTDQHHHRLGPILAQWTAWDEATAPVTATEVPSVSTTSSTYVDMIHQNLTTWSATYPGLSISAGGHAQQFKSSNALRELRGNDGCVPVRCWAYCWAVGAGAAGTLAFQTERYSIATLPVASSTPTWRRVTGHLRCGVGPEDASVLQIFGRASSGTLHVSNICIEYADL